MGKWRFCQPAEWMAQGDFETFVAAKVVGLSGGQLNLDVQAFDGADRHLSAPATPIEEEGAMTTQGPGRLAERRLTNGGRQRCAMKVEAWCGSCGDPRSAGFPPPH